MAMIQPVILVSKDAFPVPKPPVIDKLKEPIQSVEAVSPAPTFKPAAQFAPRPSPFEELADEEQLTIARRLALKDTLTLRGKRNTFTISNSRGDEIYTVEEVSRWWAGYVLYAHRPLKLVVRNHSGDTVMTMDRPYAMTARVVPCQTQIMRVFAGEDIPLGTVEQQWTAIKPVYNIMNNGGDIVFRIKGPFVTINYLKKVRFSITRPDGAPVGGSDKKREGLMHTLLFSTLNHKVGLNFDTALDVNEKALLLAATLLINYMYYDD